MDIDFLGFSLQVLGEILIAIAVLRMHGKLSEEHRIDKKVISTIHQEKRITYLAILLILVGYVLQIPFK